VKGPNKPLLGRPAIAELKLVQPITAVKASVTPRWLYYPATRGS